jgi:hypothetical protein
LEDAVEEAAAADGTDDDVGRRVVELGDDLWDDGAVSGPDVGVVEGGCVDCCFARLGDTALAYMLKCTVNVRDVPWS